MAEQLTAAQIGDVLNKLVESGFDYQEDYTNWQDALYDAWNSNQEDSDVVRAALVYLTQNVGNADTVWTPKQFRRLMESYYKAKYATTGDFAKEYVTDIRDLAVDTIEEFTDFIDWDQYAKSQLSGNYAFIQLTEDGDVFVFEDDFNI